MTLGEFCFSSQIDRVRALLRALRRSVPLSIALVLAACAATEEPEKKKPDPQGRPKIVGRVASIPPGNSFVLIQSFGDWTIADGTVLTTRGTDERAGNLLVTGEKLGQFAAADIQSGVIHVGDAVLMLPAVPAKVSPEAAPPQTVPAVTVDAPPTG